MYSSLLCINKLFLLFFCFVFKQTLKLAHIICSRSSFLFISMHNQKKSNRWMVPFFSRNSRGKKQQHETCLDSTLLCSYPNCVLTIWKGKCSTSRFSVPFLLSFFTVSVILGTCLEMLV